MKTYQCNDNLRRLRRARDYSQEYLAFELGITQKAYSNIELGKTRMREDLLFELSRLLEISPFEICPNSCTCKNQSLIKLHHLLSYLNSNNIKIPKEILED